MKIILLIFTFILFWSRIKNTKINFSYNDYMRREEDSRNKLRNYIEKDATLAKAYILFVWFLYTFIAIYYLYFFLNGGIILKLLTILQFLTLYQAFHELNILYSSLDVSKAKYNGLFLKSNVILDYVYYPLVIISLIF